MDLKNKLETEKGKDAYPKAGVKLIYAGMYKNEIDMNDNGDSAHRLLTWCAPGCYAGGREFETLTGPTLRVLKVLL